MRNLIKRFLRNERGATATEYAMLIVFIALAIATGAQAFSGGLNTWFRAVSANIAGLNNQIPGPGN
jgi:pilus assembly protein Flp/PilA